MIHYQDDEKFSYFLSAFLSAVRSITFHMQKQFGKTPGFAEWYCIEQVKMRGDNELDYINEARVEEVHKNPVKTGARRSASTSCDAILVYEWEKDLIVEQCDEKTKNTEAVITTSRRYFLKFKQQEVINFCNQQLQKLLRLVDECEAKFLRGTETDN